MARAYSTCGDKPGRAGVVRPAFLRILYARTAVCWAASALPTTGHSLKSGAGSKHPLILQPNLSYSTTFTSHLLSLSIQLLSRRGHGLLSALIVRHLRRTVNPESASDQGVLTHIVVQ